MFEKFKADMRQAEDAERAFAAAMSSNTDSRNAYCEQIIKKFDSRIASLERQVSELQNEKVSKCEISCLWCRVHKIGDAALKEEYQCLCCAHKDVCKLEPIMDNCGNFMCVDCKNN